MKRVSFLFAAILCFAISAAGASGLTNPFFAFDNGSGRDQHVPLDEQADLVQRTGYAGLGFTGTQHIPEILQALESRGLKLFSIYVAAHIDGDKPSYEAGLPQAIQQLEGHGTVIWLTVRGTAPDGDARATAVIREIAGMAAASGLRVALYPHMGMYVGRIEDALRIVKLVDRPNVGVSFNLAHFLAVKDEPNLDTRLREARPYLFMVSINGADHEGGWDRLIQPLDRGEFDVYGLLSKLNALGYDGPIGLQCYQVPGDREENLRRSMAAWRTFAARMADEKPEPSFQPRAVPLVTTDPYFSIWSFADHLTDDVTRHWTGTPQSLDSAVKVDGITYRLMGKLLREESLPQTGLAVLPTRTLYDFEGAGVHVRLTFLTPLLPDNLDVLSRPVTYLIWEVRSVDDHTHQVSVFFANSAQLVVNTEDQAVVWSRETIGDLIALRMGSAAQPVLAKSGDNLRIDWGYLYAAAPKSEVAASAIANPRALHQSIAETGSLPSRDKASTPQPANKSAPLMAFVFDFGQVSTALVARHLILAYDDLYSIEYFHQKLRPYWRRNGAQAADLLKEAERDYDSLREGSAHFDSRLMTDMTRAGGAKYARLAALAYRQSLAAHKLATAPDGQTPYYFPKENFSCGCISTVDVIYPAAPILLLLNPQLVEASLAPLMDYVKAGKWPLPYAPHDLGVYPLANGRDLTKIETMPVEESGNMLILFAAIAKAEGNASFAEKYAAILQQWANYLVDKGLDPENQLCTDDFAGHLAHNTNLSIKAILGLGSYAQLLDMEGHSDRAQRYRSKAQEFAQRWVRMATDGNHFRLAFDKPGTWSQKYNLVWDKILGLNLFPPEVARQEIAFYEDHLNRYGLPLDSRKSYTKLDWELWTATLAESPADWEKLIAPIYDWVSQSPTRVPLTDWYWTRDGTQVGFQARSVVGGLFIKMLSDPAVWRSELAARAPSRKFAK